MIDATRPQAAEGTDATFAQLFDRWIGIDLDKPAGDTDLAESTVQAHRMLYRRHIGPAIGDTKLRELNTMQLERFYGQLHRPKPLGAGLHPRSIRRVHAIINTALKRAMAWQWIARNPAEFAKPPRIHGRPDTYTPTLIELQRALEAALTTGPWVLALVWTAAATGMRRGELCGLQWADIDGQTQTIHVRRAIVDVGGKPVEKLPKTGKGRQVDIPVELVAVLAAYQATEDVTGPWLWAVSGQRVHPDKLTDTWNQVKALAGIPKTCRLHDLRHAYGTIILEHGGEGIVAAVADQLGHSDMTTTMRNYLASVSSGRRRAADLMGQLLDGTQPDG